ncbi:hypothetical protein CFSAN002368_14768 [Clostridium botulinum A1 str. CFSAN002368]|nr:hypothetical protein CFSAN002368_14768 [Clostridium botulinum A1 str. CFSAN002368]
MSFEAIAYITKKKAGMNALCNRMAKGLEVRLSIMLNGQIGPLMLDNV